MTKEQVIRNHCVCHNPTTLQIGNMHEDTVPCQICGLSRASGVVVVVSGPSAVPVVFRLVRSWLLCNSGFWSHVSGWLTSVEVFAAVPLGVSCFLSCLVGGYFVARWNVGAQAGCFIAALGYRRPPRHAHTSRVLGRGGGRGRGCGASGTGANAVDKKATSLGVFKNKRAPGKGLNTYCCSPSLMGESATLQQSQHTARTCTTSKLAC